MTTGSIEDLLKNPAKVKTKATTANDDDNDKKKKKPSVKDELATVKLERKMKALDLQEHERLAQVQADKVGAPYINLIGFPISPDTLATITKDQARNLQVLSFLNLGDQIRLGAIHPTDEKVKELADELGENNHAKVEVYQISQHSYDETMKIFEKLPVYVKPVIGVEIGEKDLDQYKDIGKDFSKLNEMLKKVSVTDIFTLIIAAAIQSNASDIHIEAEEKDVKVRFRVDGVLHDAASLDTSLWPKVISRMKLIAKLKLNIITKPQDGRFTIVLSKDKIDVRVSTLPTAYGESVVMRLLKSSAAGLQFEQLGVIGIAATHLQEQVERHKGMIITTGPTGSGKTTTLYAILNKLNDQETKIITLEDPIEYRLNGINQSQIDHSKNYTFADGLRSILRQDPDVVMVGEIRDLETADVALNAAMTGHLVISTIHTNSAAGAIPRFLAMGVQGYLLAPAINAIIGQRLVRRICENCKEEYTPESDQIERVKKSLNAIPDGHPDKPDLSDLHFFRGKGCEVCNNLKYKGRVGIYEILIMSPEIEKIILSGQVSEYQMQDLAVKAGMLTMAQDGLIKVLKGMTDLEEVFRVSE